MDRYFFDIVVSDGLLADKTGHDFATPALAMREADELARVIRDTPGNECVNPADIVVAVRNAPGAEIGRVMVAARSFGARAHLLARCLRAHARGADFPTVYTSIIDHHPLVAGSPIQDLRDGTPILRIPLVAGRHLVHGRHGYSIE